MNAAQKVATTTKKWLPKHGQWVHFTHRDVMRANRPIRAKATLPDHCRASTVPVTTLPVDCTGNATVSCPMLGNDTVGDCGPVLCAHKNQIRTYGQGKPAFAECAVNQAALIAQYEVTSGGDNGTTEDMLVGADGIWSKQGIAGDPTQVIVDHLDVDVLDVALVQYCHDWFYGVEVAWSVPDAFLNGFTNGSVWAAAATPDPENGHFTTHADVGGHSVIDDVDVNGFYRVWTWGAYCWQSPAFLGSVDPQAFVTFSALQFLKSTGYDSHGRHVSDVAAAWVSIGGNAALVDAVVATFPAKAAPAPAPAPTPTPSGVLSSSQVTAVNGAVDGVFTAELPLVEKVALQNAIKIAVAALGPVPA